MHLASPLWVASFAAVQTLAATLPEHEKVLSLSDHLLGVPKPSGPLRAEEHR